MPRKPATSTTGIKLDSNARLRLKSLAKVKNRSQHWLMKEAIERYLSEEEENERIKRETLERWERYIETGEAIPHASVEAWLKTWGTDRERPWPRGGA